MSETRCLRQSRPYSTAHPTFIDNVYKYESDGSCYEYQNVSGVFTVTSVVKEVYYETKYNRRQVT